jgi:aerobic carbon-monoxide dehydrogenase medium subunit
MTSIAFILYNFYILKYHNYIADAARNVGDPLDRNRGTVGGHLAWNDPAADLPAAVLAFETMIEVIGPKGQRMVPADKFFDPFVMALQPEEIITAVVLPALAPDTGSAYEKFKHPANHSAICGVAALITCGSGGLITACRVAITGASDRVTRLRAVEAALQSQEPTTANIEAAAQRAGDGLTFRSDLAASAEYRSHLAMVLTERVLFHASQRLGLSGHE